MNKESKKNPPLIQGRVILIWLIVFRQVEPVFVSEETDNNQHNTDEDFYCLEGRIQIQS